MKIISNILKKIYRGILFDSTTERDYTLFNHYIIEIAPEIKNFFKNLIDVILPLQLENLLSESYSFNEDYEEIEFEQPKIAYNYFTEYTDEIVKMQSICFSIPDFLIIWNLFNLNKNDYKNDSIFYKSLEKINYQENYLTNIVNNNENSIQFFLLSNTTYNPSKKKYLNKEEKSYTFTDDIKNDEFILQRIKFSIKLILKGLNMINKKVYSLLVDSETNLKFLEIINKIIQIEEDLSDNALTDKIPLSWYSLFMINNIRNIPYDYQNNNFKMLYDEILNECSDKISYLKEKGNILNTQFGMNMRCSEKLIEKSQRDLLCTKKIEKILRIDNFIRKTNIEACLKNNKISNDESKKNLQNE